MKKILLIIFPLLVFLIITPSDVLATASWTSTGSLKIASYDHTATKLSNGEVLVAGGIRTCANVRAELYDPSLGSWSYTGFMSVDRTLHTANLVTASGGAEKVLVAGGNASCSSGIKSSTELYDTSTGAWSSGPSMNVARFSHTATMLQDGTVLVAGGGSGINSVENYNPISNSFSTKSSMIITRVNHTATLLNDGTVLAVGGYTSSGSATATAEIYDPSTDQWTLVQSMNKTRTRHTATLLPNGKVLIVGGSPASSSNTAEVYDPSTNAWSLTPTLSYNHANHTANLITLTGGSQNVLISGSSAGNNDKVELYDYTGNTWSITVSLNTARSMHTATLLNDGTVLVAGGKVSGAASKLSEFYTAP